MHTSASLSIDLRQPFAGQRTAPMIAALVLTLGIAAVTADCLEVRQPAIFNLHLLFGISLWLSVGGCLLRQRRVSDLESPARYHEYARRLSRWVYILLYLLAGVRLAFHVGEIVNQFNAVHGSGPEHTQRSLDDFQIYIAYALVPLWAMRFLILYLPQRVSPGSSASRFRREIL